MKLKNFVSVILAVGLSGCTFNVDRERLNRDDGDWRDRSWGDTRPSPSGVELRQPVKCPMYVPPEKPALPRAPTEEYEKLPRHANNAREALLLTYIEQLRYHIKDVNTANVDQYMKYLQACMGQSRQK